MGKENHDTLSLPLHLPSVYLLLSAVGIATRNGLDDKGVGVRVPVGSRIFSSPCHPDSFWAHPTSCTVGTGGSFPGNKAARA
jgi:hypothetical protein